MRVWIPKIKYWVMLYMCDAIRLNYLVFYVSYVRIIQCPFVYIPPIIHEQTWRTMKTTAKRLQPRSGLLLYTPVYPWRPWRAEVFFLFLYQINIQFIKVFRVFRDITDIYTLKNKSRLKTSSEKVFRGLQGLQENIDKEYEILQNIFSA